MDTVGLQGKTVDRQSYQRPELQRLGVQTEPRVEDSGEESKRRRENAPGQILPDMGTERVRHTRRPI